MKKFITIVMLVLVVFSLAACGGGGESSSDTGHLYDNAVVEDVKSGDGSNVIGQYAYIKADSADVDIDALADVYFNYYKENDFNWLMIVYTDKDEKAGAYFMSGMVSDNVEVKYDGQYILGSEDNAVYYVPSDDGTLKEFE